MVLGVAVLALGVGTVAVVAASGVSPRWLPNCVGQPQARPSTVIFACADAGFSAQKLVWYGWGGATTVAVGTASVNDCTPSCVAGHFHSYRIVLVVNGTQHCPGNKLAYEEVSYGFIGRSPFPADSEGTTEPTYRFRCH